MCLVCAACAALALVLPATAAAKPGYVVHPGSFELNAFLPHHDGFSYLINAESHHRVQLTVSKGSASVIYRAKGRASSRGVHADFGPLGRINLRFELSTGETPPFLPQGGRCRGRSMRVFPGKFRGSVRFEGEPGVKGITSHRGFVVVEHKFKTVCKQRRRHRRPHKQKKKQEKIELDFLFAKSHAEGRKAEFGLVNLVLPTKPHFSLAISVGGVSERRGGVTITRSAIELEEEVLRLSKLGSNPETATATPPKPFLGSATYSASRGSAPTWTGDLRVRLPGAGAVPLTGPGFHVRLCRGFAASTLDRRCFQGSGSHSQSLAEAKLSSLRYLWNSSSSAGSTLYTWSGSGKWRLRTSLP